MKKLLSVVLVGCLMLGSLTSCASTKEEATNSPTEKTTEQQTDNPTEKATEQQTDEPEDETQSETPAVETDPYPTIANGDITILWHTTEEAYKESLAVNPKHYDAVWSNKKAFEDKYGGTVTVIAVGWGDMQPTLISMVTNGEVCDLAEANDQNFPIYPAKKLVLPLDDILDVNSDAFKPSVGKTFSLSGSTYAVGSDITATQLYYNKDLFEAYGVKTPDEYYAENNWTWDTFKATALEFVGDTDGDGTNDQFGFGWWDTMYISFLASNKIPIISYGGNEVKANYTNPDAIAAFQFEQDGYVKDSYISTGDYVAEFLAGKLAMTLDHGIGGWRDASFTLGVVPFPRGPKADADYGQGLMTGWCIPVTSANIEGAAAFAYMSSKNRDSFLFENLSVLWDEATVSRYMSVLPYVQFSPIGIEKFWDANWQIHSNLIEGTPVSTFAQGAVDIINEGVKITFEQ